MLVGLGGLKLGDVCKARHVQWPTHGLIMAFQHVCLQASHPKHVDQRQETHL